MGEKRRAFEMRNLKESFKAISLTIIVLSFPLHLWAAWPYEKFHVAYSDSLVPVLRQTIAVLTISAGPTGPTNGTEFKFTRRKETVLSM